MPRTLLVLLAVLHFSKTKRLPLPLDEYSFRLARTELETEEALQNVESTSFTENQVSLFFEKLKQDELSRYFPSRPLETQLENMQRSRLYGVLRQMPKGGNLHVHFDQMLDRLLLLRIVQNSTEYNYLYICDRTKPFCSQSACTCPKFHLTFFKVRLMILIYIK